MGRHRKKVKNVYIMLPGLDEREHFYVYALARPNGRIFYIGKGIGDRVNYHESRARTGCACDKCQIIQNIWRQGGMVIRRIMYAYLNEHDALLYEAHMIERLRPQLVNIQHGRWGSLEPDARTRSLKLRNLCGRVYPTRQRPRNEEHREEEWRREWRNELAILLGYWRVARQRGWSDEAERLTRQIEAIKILLGSSQIEQILLDFG